MGAGRSKPVLDAAFVKLVGNGTVKAERIPDDSPFWSELVLMFRTAPDVVSVGFDVIRSLKEKNPENFEALIRKVITTLQLVDSFPSYS